MTSAGPQERFWTDPVGVWMRGRRGGTFRGIRQARGRTVSTQEDASHPKIHEQR